MLPCTYGRIGATASMSRCVLRVLNSTHPRVTSVTGAFATASPRSAEVGSNLVPGPTMPRIYAPCGATASTSECRCKSYSSAPISSPPALMAETHQRKIDFLGETRGEHAGDDVILRRLRLLAEQAARKGLCRVTENGPLAPAKHLYPPRLPADADADDTPLPSRRRRTIRRG